VFFIGKPNESDFALHSVELRSFAARNWRTVEATVKNGGRARVRGMARAGERGKSGAAARARVE
jgi:hypothetical protein